MREVIKRGGMGVRHSFGPSDNKNGVLVIQVTAAGHAKVCPITSMTVQGCGLCGERLISAFNGWWFPFRGPFGTGSRFARARDLRAEATGIRGAPNAARCALARIRL
ncbi:hypothetical protein GCM10025778_26020 [Paeniglutamicibacter antarcticus]|uniref:Uncharacterized protein n=1 Tax=Paeniglutamicibacter antarcticus TaxID=494023 RepID=A0ABP9TSJ4_9MICC